ncbi:MAG TPA: MBL fold metallo-hydrolase [Solirubrobacterales bacterium]|nr:MBL fold metallo-hydrolase [Solirubrobacterales bacterium]
MRQLAPDLWQLRGLPPNGINVYLAEDVLIDAATRRAGRRILRQIQDRPLSLLALTHVHPDHQGAASEVCEARRVPLACHAADVDAMEGRRPMGSPEHRGNLVNRVIMRYWAGPPRMVHRVLNEGDEVAGFTVIHAPGHAPGEVIFFRESDRVAIAGDVINTMNIWTGLPSVREPPDILTLDPAENRRSIRKLLDLRPSLVCVGHGAPLHDISKLARLVGGLPPDGAARRTPPTGRTRR